MDFHRLQVFTCMVLWSSLKAEASSEIGLAGHKEECEAVEYLLTELHPG